MNAFLDKYNRNIASLAQFVDYFDRALRRIWEREHECDHESKYKTPVLRTAIAMEKQFRPGLLYKHRFIEM